MKSSDDDKLKKVFDNFKNNLEIDNGIERRLMKMVEQREHSLRRRKILMSAVSLAVAAFLVISSAVPIFGKSGTLPQVITGISLQKTASSFVGSIKTSSGTMKKLESQNLSPTDSVIIAALVKQTDTPIDEIVQMREDGMGWGKILSALGVSASDVKDALSKAATSVANNSQQNDENNNPSGPDNENKQNETQASSSQVLVVKGTIETISDNVITANGKSINLTDKTVITYHGKTLTKDKLLVGDEVLIKATKTEEGVEATSITVIKTNSDENNNKGGEQEQNGQQENKEFELRSSIVSFDGSILKIKDFDNDIVVNENTKIQESGTGRVEDSSVLKADDVVQIHIQKTDDKYYATSIVILKSKDENKQNGQDKGGQGNANSQNILVKGAIEGISENDITVSGETITITNKTSIKYHGKSITKDKLLVGDEVLIKATKTEEGIEATSITVIKSNNPNNAGQSTPKKETFKDTVKAVDPGNGTITIAGFNEVFKVSSNTVIIYQGKTITLESINVGDSVNILGTKQEDGSISVEKIIITKRGSNNPGNNNGNGNGKGNNKGKGKP